MTTQTGKTIQHSTDRGDLVSAYTALPKDVFQEDKAALLRWLLTGTYVSLADFCWPAAKHGVKA